MSKLIVSLVSYNSDINELSKVFSFIKKNLKSTKVFVFDNAKQKSLEFFCKQRGFNYFASKKNIGFGKGHNYNIKKSYKKNSIYLILNPDVFLNIKDVNLCLKILSSKKTYGLLSPKLINEDGSTQLICRIIPNFFNFISRFLFKSDNYSKEIHKYIENDNKKKYFLNIPFIHGACYFIKSEVIHKIGVYDENFFMYVEDLDWYRRISQNYDTIYLKSVTVLHKFGRKSHKNLNLFFIHFKSIIYYFLKWGLFNDIDRANRNYKFIDIIINSIKKS